MNFYIISDTHFNHADKMRELCGRPDNYEDLIKRNIRNIAPDSVLIHLGDVTIGRDKEAHEDYLRLKPRALNWLILGNHDRKSVGWYLNAGWNFVGHAVRLEYMGHNILFSHDAAPWDGWYTVNIHGHFHNSEHREYRDGVKRDACALFTLENEGYSPVRLDKFIQKWEQSK